jgi:hypothetical protein
MTERKIQLMHKMYGQNTAHKCEECCNFVVKKYSRTYFKCERYSTGASESSDWARRWTACGMFNHPMTDKFKPVVEMIRPDKTNKPMEGQMTL